MPLKHHSLIVWMLGALALMTGPVGCAHRRPAHPTEPEADLPTRTAKIADGVLVHATPWDERMVEAAASDATARARLRRRYVSGGPVFTVVLDLSHRAAHDDVLASADAWSFALVDHAGEHPAASVDIEGIDRFPTPSDQHVHVRVMLRVAFAEAATADAPRRLRVKSRAKVRSRAALGRFMARRGITLSWRRAGLQGRT